MLVATENYNSQLYFSHIRLLQTSATSLGLPIVPIENSEEQGEYRNWWKIIKNIHNDHIASL